MVALLAAALLREEFTSAKKLGFAFILPGVLAIVWGSGSELGSRQNVGHGLFLSAALAWAFYTVAMRKARLDGFMRQRYPLSDPCFSICRFLP